MIWFPWLDGETRLNLKIAEIFFNVILEASLPYKLENMTIVSRSSFHAWLTSLDLKITALWLELILSVCWIILSKSPLPACRTCFGQDFEATEYIILFVFTANVCFVLILFYRFTKFRFDLRTSIIWQVYISKIFLLFSRTTLTLRGCGFIR